MDQDTLPKTYKLNNGLEMPSIGLGTAGSQGKESMVNAIMKVGYAHIDTAFCYKNEEVVGQALDESFKAGKKREDMFITTKIWHSQYGDVEGACRGSIKALGLEYLDLYLIHWPAGYYAEVKKPMHVLWAEMEALVEKGLTKSIGVSNFNVQMLMDMMCYAKIMPVCDQVELNPQNPQVNLVKFLHAKNIVPVAFTPVARPQALEKGDTLVPKDWPDLTKDPLLQSMAQKYSKSVVQIMLNWGLCKGHCVIPKANGHDHQAQNMEVFDFKLSKEECDQIDGLNKDIRCCNKFEFIEKFDIFA